MFEARRRAVHGEMQRSQKLRQFLLENVFFAERGHVFERHALFSIGQRYILECILPYAGLAELETRPSAIRRPTGFLKQ
jgi:hypothetical protein